MIQTVKQGGWNRGRGVEQGLCEKLALGRKLSLECSRNWWQEKKTSCNISTI